MELACLWFAQNNANWLSSWVSILRWDSQMEESLTMGDPDSNCNSVWRWHSQAASWVCVTEDRADTRCPANWERGGKSAVALPWVALRHSALEHHLWKAWRCTWQPCLPFYHTKSSLWEANREKLWIRKTKEKQDIADIINWTNFRH